MRTTVSLRERVARKKAAARSALLYSDEQCLVDEQPQRGRCVSAATPLQAGTIIEMLSGAPFAACLLQSGKRHCEHCFAEVCTPMAERCPRGCQAVYCSVACRNADFCNWPHECMLANMAELPLGAHAVQSEDLAAAADPESLDRFGTLLLAARCLWRRHRARDSAAAAQEGANMCSPSDAELFDVLAQGPCHDDDMELAQMGVALPGFLPPDASAERVVLMIGQLRANYASITDGSGGIIGAGCFPRQARLNHSCAPNCVLTFGLGGFLRVRTIDAIATGVELLIACERTCRCRRLGAATLAPRPAAPASNEGLALCNPLPLPRVGSSACFADALRHRHHPAS